jgi:hypothetical protein
LQVSTKQIIFYECEKLFWPKLNIMIPALVMLIVTGAWQAAAVERTIRTDLIK